MTGSADLRARLESFVGERLGHRVVISNLQRSSGGASRDTWTFACRWANGERRMVLRRGHVGAQTWLDRPPEAEFEMLRLAAQTGVPVPRVLWTAGPEELGSHGFLMDFVEGETIARRILREDRYEPARQVFASQCGAILARIKSIDLTSVPGVAFSSPTSDPAAPVLGIRAFLDTFDDPHPVFELAIRWLEPRAPQPTEPVLVHGDFRMGNVIVTPEGIAAVLDWEGAHIGSRWEDMAWVLMRPWRFGGAGEVGGCGSREGLYKAYEEVAGVVVDDEGVRWWEVLSALKCGIAFIAQCHTHLSGSVRSLERAAVGRRVCEAEYDLLQLISH